MKNNVTKHTMRLAMMAVLLVSSLGIWAQEDEEYRMEIGAGVGVTGYLGDFNPSLTKNLQPSASIVLRRYFNPYMGLKAQLGYGKMKGQAADVETFYPEYQGTDYKFDNTLVGLDIT